MNSKRPNSEELLHCSFCRKPQELGGQTYFLSGDLPRAYICDECVAVCNSILEEERNEEVPTTQAKLPRPPEIKAFLDQYVVGQEKTKKKLAVAVYNHYAGCRASAFKENRRDDHERGRGAGSAPSRPRAPSCSRMPACAPWVRRSAA